MWQVADIVGSEVVDQSGVTLGILEDVLPSGGGGNDIWVVRSPSLPKGEMLIPALKSVVLSVDPEQKKIIVNIPPGLKEIYEG